ncbi:response regulator [Clostridium rectalis]|uniref:response regulator n=1 Tax=Clostridium rectalis TaxID=2040295 RepID=UPI000F63414A|nr:response regulator [Clostridium rectalis]
MANVLVVDDSAIMRVNIRSILKSGGHNVVAEAENADQAYFEYKKFRPELITMDVNMPGMNGIDATKKIIKKFPEAKVIIVSSLEQKNLVVDALEAGAKHYVLKPITSEKLLERIDQVLNAMPERVEKKSLDDELTRIKKGKKYFKIKNNKGVFVIEINSDMNLSGLKLIDEAIYGLLFVEPLNIVFDFGDIEAIDMTTYNGIVQLTKRLYEAKAAVRIIVRNKQLAKFIMHNTISSYAEICTDLGEEKEEGNEED